MAHDSIDALSVLRTCMYCDGTALATGVPAAYYTAYLQGCLPPLSRELTARSIFRRSSGNAPRHVLSACRCVFSSDEYDKTGRALYVAGGCRSNFSVWTGHGYPGKHKLHTTSCMHLWLACLGTRRTETDLLRRLARVLLSTVCRADLKTRSRNASTTTGMFYVLYIPRD